MQRDVVASPADLLFRHVEKSQSAALSFNFSVCHRVLLFCCWLAIGNRDAIFFTDVCQSESFGEQSLAISRWNSLEHLADFRHSIQFDQTHWLRLVAFDTNANDDRRL